MSEATTITVVVENAVHHKQAWAEEGLSILVDHRTAQAHVRLLLDCGRSGTVALHNFDALGIDASVIAYLVLSHGHAGHVGGVFDVAHVSGQPTILLGTDIEAQKLKRTSTGDFAAAHSLDVAALESAFSVRRITSSLYLTPSLAVFGGIPMGTGTTDPSQDTYFLRRADGVVPDLFDEELALAIRTPLGVVVITSCAHRGVANTARHALSIFPHDVLRGIIGGFHLQDDTVRTDSLIDYLSQAEPQILAPCHCTGSESTHSLRHAFPDSYRSCHAGDTITL